MVLIEICITGIMDAAERHTRWGIQEILILPTVMDPSMTSLAAITAKQDRPQERLWNVAVVE